jgi:hypothetical protein
MPGKSTPEGCDVYSSEKPKLRTPFRSAMFVTCPARWNLNEHPLSVATERRTPKGVP